ILDATVTGVHTCALPIFLRRVRGMRLLATAGVAIVALAMAACGGNKSTSGGGGNTPAKKTVKVGLAYDIGGRGDKSFNDAAAAGARAGGLEGESGARGSG